VEPLVARRAFRAADDAQPQAVRSQQTCHARGEARSIRRLVEDVKHAAVEDEVERPTDGIVDEEVGAPEAHPGYAASLRAGHLDRALRDVDADHVEALPGKPDGVRARAAADLERAAGRHDAAPDELRQVRIRFIRVPRQLAAEVLPVPVVLHRRSPRAPRAIRPSSPAGAPCVTAR